MCIETDIPTRPPGYGEMITKYLDEKGYRNNTHKGRNTCKSLFLFVLLTFLLWQNNFKL